MICLDTSFLVDLWRNKDVQEHPAVRILREYSGEMFCVPAHAAGEFLEGAACVSEARFQESIRFLRLFEIADIGFETAEHYGRIVAELRRRSLLSGISKTDAWIAASAIEHGASLATRNTRHFGLMPGLKLVEY